MLRKEEQKSFLGLAKTKRQMYDRSTEHFKALTKRCHTLVIADHITATDHNIKWNHFDILATDYLIYTINNTLQNREEYRLTLKEARKGF